MSILSFLFGLLAVGGSLAAIFFLIKRFGSAEYKGDVLEEIIKDLEKSQKQAKKDEKDIAAMSDADKRDELSR